MEEPKTMSIVACHDVAKIYHQGAVDVHALDDVDLEVEVGDFVALAGPSGSGKTTLLNLIGGLDTADAGEITVAGPAIVLADEPTANLDSETGRALLETMEEMNRTKGVTFIFSTHDQMVMDHARRLVHLKDGRVDRDDRREG